MCVNMLANAQTPQDAAESSEGIKPFSAVWRSLLIPGWGQVYQERLTQGVILYGGAWITYSKTFNSYLTYRKNRSPENLQNLKNNAALSGFFYLLNVADILDAAYRVHPKGWQGALLSDKPLKSPWGAAMRSMIIPGMGQIYNENYWMAGIYFSSCAFLTYKVYDANQKYQATGETKYKDSRSDYSWYLGVAYLITMADAYVNAYLYRFDDMMRLTVSPFVVPDGGGVAFNVVF